MQTALKQHVFNVHFSANTALTISEQEIPNAQNDSPEDITL